MEILVNGRVVTIGPADVREVEPGVFSILQDGASLEVRVAQEGAGYRVEVQGQPVAVEVRDPRASTGRSGSAVAGGKQTIAAAMPGKVVRVLVEEGQDVAAGQGLIVVEAMKMQNEMKAAKAGKVSKIHVADGATVGAGQALITVI